jgi:pimeloyl-[acyl-carrier protein] methyl ester esterase
VKLLFVHGWGFDASFWDDLAARLDHFEQVRDDRGYFGSPAPMTCSGRCVAVTHSFGTMRLLSEPPAGLAGVIAINGFDRFIASDDFPGVPPRLVDTMIARFDRRPRAVLDDFLGRCGCGPARYDFDRLRLAADLERMRTTDVRGVTAGLDMPLLSLQSAHDRIVPAAMRDAALAGSGKRERHEHPDAGHLLPTDEPDWCAAAIAAFLEKLS